MRAVPAAGLHPVKRGRPVVAQHLGVQVEQVGVVVLGRAGVPVTVLIVAVVVAGMIVLMISVRHVSTVSEVAAMA